MIYLHIGIYSLVYIIRMPLILYNYEQPLTCIVTTTLFLFVYCYQWTRLDSGSGWIRSRVGALPAHGGSRREKQTRTLSGYRANQIQIGPLPMCRMSTCVSG
jgi:hypothetical protein